MNCEYAMDNQRSVYVGSYRSSMLALLSDFCRPFNVLDVMQLYTDHCEDIVALSPSSGLLLPLTEFVDTCDAVAYHPDGRIKIVRDAPPLLEVRPDTALRRHDALILDGATYDSLEGPEFTVSEQAWVNHPFTLKGALNDPATQYLLRGRAEEVLPEIYRLGWETYRYRKMLGFAIRGPPSESPELHAITVSPLRDHGYTSSDLYRLCFDGALPLGETFAESRLIGVSDRQSQRRS